jgi:hypothetical protein
MTPEDDPLLAAMAELEATANWLPTMAAMAEALPATTKPQLQHRAAVAAKLRGREALLRSVLLGLRHRLADGLLGKKGT